VRRIGLSGRFNGLGWLRPLIEASHHCLREIEVVNFGVFLGTHDISVELRDLLPAVHLEKLHFYNRTIEPQNAPGESSVAPFQ